mmetsp:Transcript_8620/g.14878  ORF Transcript_8620/g.14878 Transcript_8620/m.14878 type:complete len:589 (-) Transcript_8620:493-2259(-)|eukprot:CAMPEP_0196654022 /NCGR_PEP_ID=MMETSP1086-20130531/3703_1 /TAXON_ID=77921 /ORGANISM="Cyanoptyche  gloeocystis , Strain SAG4.97" /LENGTH=588 /DNA_ID=CAMNT_0041985539 /DNA_START=68 /DNA_END=1834 /DNA_ORIENTATION=-
MKPKWLTHFGIAVFVISFALVSSDDHVYKDGQGVPFYANKVGPYANPSETYQYYSLPFCPPEHLEFKNEDIGEVLEGDRMVKARYELNFREDFKNKPLCKKTLSDDDIREFQDAIEQDYYFEMYYDDLPVWGFIGEMDKRIENGEETSIYFLFTHLQFTISYNGNQIIEIVVVADPLKRKDITKEEPVEVEFTYSAKWITTDIHFESRMDKYSRHSFLPQHLEIHWFSIINSCVTVFLLTGFLATILLRMLKNDFVKYTREDEEDDQEDTGWKLIHGDVFRFPRRVNVFSSIIGIGTHLLVIILCIFFLALVGVFYPYNRGAMYKASVVLYAVTSGISGYVGASWYKKLGGENWVWNVMLTATLFAGPFFLMFCFLNSVALSYDSTAALPFGTIFLMLLIWSLVAFPLTVVGGIAGKNIAGPFTAPCRTSKVPREIPPLPWYRQAPAQMIMAGFLPFSAIYIELYYIFTSVWGHKSYTIYSILFIVFIILMIVTSFITIALTYFQLAIEDHEWWWRSIFSGGSTGLFIFGYCFYYYLARSDMSGFMQTAFFFGYMFVICYGFFLMLGSIGFYSSLMFVKHIYKAIKCD